MFSVLCNVFGFIIRAVSEKLSCFSMLIQRESSQLIQINIETQYRNALLKKSVC